MTPDGIIEAQERASVLSLTVVTRCEQNPAFVNDAKPMPRWESYVRCRTLEAGGALGDPSQN